jgi:hypothetical protein
MTPGLIQGDHVSCSRLGGALRRESSRLLQRAQSLEESLLSLTASQPSAADPATAAPLPAAASAITTSLLTLRACAGDLDDAGAALQRYATDLAESHELGRRAERRVAGAGLLLEGTRVIEPWGPASAPEAERRRALVPEVQSRVDLTTAHVGRARGRLEREALRLTDGFSARSLAVRAAQQAPLPARRI